MAGSNKNKNKNCKVITDDMVNTAPISIVSYNLHGFNQGCTLLSALCSDLEFNTDCIFIQENWLTPK